MSPLWTPAAPSLAIPRISAILLSRRCPPVISTVILHPTVMGDVSTILFPIVVLIVIPIVVLRSPLDLVVRVIFASPVASRGIKGT